VSSVISLDDLHVVSKFKLFLNQPGKKMNLLNLKAVKKMAVFISLVVFACAANARSNNTSTVDVIIPHFGEQVFLI